MNTPLRNISTAWTARRRFSQSRRRHAPHQVHQGAAARRACLSDAGYRPAGSVRGARRAHRVDQRRARPHHCGSRKCTAPSTEMISGGALCVVKVDTGEPLALVSYPTYDAATMLENYETLVADENARFITARSWAFTPPGSTFKPCTATAALAEGIISPDAHAEDRRSVHQVHRRRLRPRVLDLLDLQIHPRRDQRRAGDHLLLQLLLLLFRRRARHRQDGVLRQALRSRRAHRHRAARGHRPDVPQSFKEQYTGISWFQGDTLQTPSASRSPNSRRCRWRSIARPSPTAARAQRLHSQGSAGYDYSKRSSSAKRKCSASSISIPRSSANPVRHVRRAL